MSKIQDRDQVRKRLQGKTAVTNLRKNLKCTDDDQWNQFIAFFGTPEKLGTCLLDKSLEAHPNYPEALTFMYNKQVKKPQDKVSASELREDMRKFDDDEL